jgi:hypothetical protein
MIQMQSVDAVCRAREMHRMVEDLYLHGSHRIYNLKIYKVLAA